MSRTIKEVLEDCNLPIDILNVENKSLWEKKKRNTRLCKATNFQTSSMEYTVRPAWKTSRYNNGHFKINEPNKYKSEVILGPIEVLYPYTQIPHFKILSVTPEEYSRELNVLFVECATHNSAVIRFVIPKPTKDVKNPLMGDNGNWRITVAELCLVLKHLQTADFEYSIRNISKKNDTKHEFIIVKGDASKPTKPTKPKKLASGKGTKKSPAATKGQRRKRE